MSLHGVDLVLTDVVMPETAGEALAQDLRARAPHLKTIAMTGHVIGGDAKKLRDAGFSDVLSKTVSIEELATILRDPLDSPDV